MPHLISLIASKLEFMKYRWVQTPLPSEKALEDLRQELKINPILVQLLVQRGITTYDEAKDFFRPSLKKLHDPFLMLDMDKAVTRINKAIKREEKILIYGDYDVDGTTAVSLLSSFLKDHYPNFKTYVPDRYSEGYGVSKQGVDFARNENISLIIALDCGVKAVDKVDYALSLGIDFIICDHHLPGDQLPRAVALLDPKREGCAYPFKELSGCGIGFKLVQALCSDWGLSYKEWLPLLDLLAVSIGSDIVPITGENRILAYHGLVKINTNPRPGFALLKELAGKKDQKLSIMDVVFMIGPRINAAGRISHGKLAVDLLTGTDLTKIEADSLTINEQNTERKELDRSITASALDMIEGLKEQERSTTVLYDQKWHKGVIGIVASRLIETYYRPTVVFTESNGKLAGSARSVKGFDIYKALERCDHILEQFGGHKYAAGMTLVPENFEHFKLTFEKVVDELILPEQRIPVIEVDAELNLMDIQNGFYKILKQFAPFGPENMNPVFQTNGLVDTGYSSVVGSDGSHLRVVLRDPDADVSISGIGFGMADKIELILSGKPVSVVYHLDENEYKGRKNLQLRLKDLRLSEEVR